MKILINSKKNRCTTTSYSSKIRREKERFSFCRKKIVKGKRLAAGGAYNEQWLTTGGGSQRAVGKLCVIGGQAGMDITMGIICFQLQQLYQLDTNISMRREIPVKKFRIWDGEKPENDILYVCSSKPPEGEQWHRKLHIGIQYEEKTVSDQSFFISIRDGIDFYRLVNDLQEIFQKFYNWKANIERLCYHYERFDVILNELEQTYDLISMLVDKNLKYIAMSDSYSLYNSWASDSSTMSFDMVNDLMTDQKFRNAICHNKAFLYHSIDEDNVVYCYNLKIKGVYEARLLLQNKRGLPFYGGLSFAKYMGSCLTEVLAHYNDGENQGRVLYEFYNLIKDLLHGIPRSTDEIKSCLHVREWERNHIYQVYLFQFSEEQNMTVTRQYYQREIESLFENCCVMAEGEFVCCIRNLSLIREDLWDVRQELSVFLRENLCKTGISQQFDDLAQLRSYYLEAENALMLGIRSKSTWWYYSFEKMVLPYIWYRASQEIDAHQLYHPAIRTLIAYDQKEHSEMVKTVYEYMKHCYNVTQTAHALFIHRTSMVFRLQRIELLTGIDWESWETRIHIAATFELMKRVGEYEISGL